MTAHAVEVRHLSKRFRRGQMHDSLRDLLPGVIRRLTGRRRLPGELAPGDFWALRDIDFRVQPGEAFGIVGPNGAGKSTMLKLLTKILRPTLGACQVQGRVGALIEVSAGFHQDLTGRENVYLQGAIMGMRRAEIAGKLDQIVEFAGVADFIDTPVKRYSSGMNARLGFSVAAHLDPDVLIIDEVLAVGDMAFQERCIARMKEYKRRGVAIVFVSHNMQAVAELCDRAIFLDREVRAEGTAQEAIAAYLDAIAEGRTVSSGGAIEVVETRLLGPAGLPAGMVEPGAPLALEVDCVARQDVRSYHLVFIIHRSTDGLTAYHTDIDSSELDLPPLVAGSRLHVRFRLRAHLVRGQYHVTFAIEDKTFRQLAHRSPAAIITVHETRSVKGFADVELDCTASVAEPVLTPRETVPAAAPRVGSR